MRIINITLFFMIVVLSTNLNAQDTQLSNPKTFQEDKRERQLSLFADGSVQSVIDAPDGASSATGTLGISLQYPFLHSSIQVSAVGTDTQVTNSYGASLITSRGGGNFNGFGASLRWLPKAYSEIRYGIHTNGYLSSSEWVYNENEYGISVRELGIHFTGQYDDNFGTSSDNPLTLIFDIGIAHRSIAGDLANSSEQQLRESILGTSNKSWTGLELGISIKLHQITASGSYLHFGGDVDGFSGGQILTKISVNSAILSDIRRKTD